MANLEKTTGRLITVGLYIRGDLIDPQDVTRRLGINPSRSHFKGEIKKTRSGTEYSEKTGFWTLIADINSTLLDEHIAKLGELLGWNGVNASASMFAIIKLKQLNEVFVDILFCDEFPSMDSSQSFCMSEASLHFLHTLQVQVHFTLYKL